MDQNVRVRFAPSPTGALHIGGVRTALYNYLFAKKYNGTMVLRIEDTDQARFVPGAEEYIRESLEWIGIIADESPFAGGEYGPYRQSERKEIYAQYAQRLIDEGNAYYAFDTPEDLEAMRERLKAARVDTPQYNAITRTQMKNSLTLSEGEVKERLNSGEPYVIRLKVPRKEEVRLNDMVRGWVMVHSSAIDDKVLMKSDGMPTYHLANVVDDHLMKITHVIRGEEWLPSAPLHVLLYQFLGWESSMPQFAHLPLLLKPDGNGKLSKRDGDKHGFPVFPIEGKFPGKDGRPEVFNGFREEGYLPDALINFLAFLGWNPGTDQEIFSLEELIEAFSIERIGKSGAKFDIEKAKWYNQQYIKVKSGQELSTYLQKQLETHNISCAQEKLERICEAMRERVVFPVDFWKDGQFFFVKPENYDEDVVRKKWTEEAVSVLEAYRKAILEADVLSAEDAKSILNNILDKKGVKLGQVMQAVRLAITGKGAGPDLMEIIEILGKEEVADRITKAIGALPVKQVN
ncbi:Glutamyl-tRNA synthetase [Fulvivirga imtechensis AK7]|uniref:Glutamate--tRNA ligase n=1 Tax=Fulvivirga imtechensis AK7 TaxID=1237149 RepID=L8JMC1_9BACT|nr:glutamate--tRNA ligase [Fulvivirga imtechensis]ELR69960.1 Glutamyl-tRNA synthetase [Fulvivirga imtechensis AK7]